MNPELVHSHQEMAEFVRTLAEDLRLHPDSWENADLSSFLEAMSAWIQDMDGFYKNKGEALPAQPNWKMFAEILVAARQYE